MEHTKPLPLFLRYSALSVLGMLAISCYILADTFFVSQRMGTNGLAALNLAIPIYNFIHGVGLMLGMGGATKYSICKSQNDSKGADRQFTHSLYLGGLFTLLFVGCGLCFSEPLTRLMGADAAVFEMANTYLQVMLLFAPAFLLNDILVCFVRNDGNPRLAMLATVGGSVSNILLDYLFMYPCGMGIFGAILATGLAPVIGILILTAHFGKKNRGFHLAWGRIEKSAVSTQFSLGFPSLLAQLSSGIVMIVCNQIILGLEGNVGVAAYGVIANLSLVIVGIYTGIAQGMQPLVSQAYGKQEGKTAALYLRYAMVSMLLCSALLYICLACFASPVAAIFNQEQDPALQQIAVSGLQLYFTSIPFTGCNLVLSMYFTSVEQALPAHIVSLLRSLVLIVPVVYGMSVLWGMTGVWLAFPLTEGIVSLVGIGYYFRRKTTRLGTGSP